MRVLIAPFSGVFVLLSLSLISASSFGRRASDGGANLQIYYPSSSTNFHDQHHSHQQQPQQPQSQQSQQAQQQQQGDGSLLGASGPTSALGPISGAVNNSTLMMDHVMMLQTPNSEGTDDSNDEIQRYGGNFVS